MTVEVRKRRAATPRREGTTIATLREVPVIQRDPAARRALLQGEAPPEAAPGMHTFFRSVLCALSDAGLPFLVGGGYAMRQLAGVSRASRDLDVFIAPDDIEDLAGVLTPKGYRVELPFKHWLAKVRHDHGGDTPPPGEHYVDVIYNSGNGATPVDDAWFQHAVAGTLWDLPVRLCPPEEMVWSKSFVMERERCDVADVAHLIHALGPQLDWARLLERFGENWRVLHAQIVLFGFAYPGEIDKVPSWIVEELAGRMLREHARPRAWKERVCRGTLLSREQYLVDVREWGYRDARLQPEGGMRASEIAMWTAAIAKK